jgi:hypothetical protein
LKDYARNHKKRKEYVQQPGLLMVGVDLRKVKHSAYMGTKKGISCRRLGFTHTQEGFKRFENVLRESMFKTRAEEMMSNRNCPITAQGHSFGGQNLFEIPLGRSLSP